MSEESFPTDQPQPLPPELVEGVDKARYMAETENRAYDDAAFHESLARRPIEDSLVSSEDHLKQAASLRGGAKEDAERAGEKYNKYIADKQKVELTDKTEEDISESLKGEPLRFKIDAIRKNLKDIESKRAPSDVEPGSMLPADYVAGLDATERALENTFFKIVEANPSLISGLYLDSLVNYVGREVTQGRSPEDILETRRGTIKAHDVLGQELATLEMLYRGQAHYLPESEDKSWKAAVRSFHPSGELAIPIGPHEDYVDLNLARANLEALLDAPDSSDI